MPNPNPIPDWAWESLGRLESGGVDLPPKPGHKAAGRFQIQPEFVDTANRINKAAKYKYPEDAMNHERAKQMIVDYTTYFAKDPNDWRELLRIHRAGPHGRDRGTAKDRIKAIESDDPANNK